MRIGLYGGTFNPPHIGHLLLAASACEALELDTVIFVPAYQSPFKGAPPPLSIEDREEMLRLAISDNGKFQVEPYELHRGGVSYSVETMRYMRTRHPDDPLMLLMGADVFLDFGRWKNPDEIVRLATPGVAERRGFPIDAASVPFGRDAVFFPMPLIDVSAGDIRRRVAGGYDIRYLVPWTVKTFIEARGLYRA